MHFVIRCVRKTRRSALVAMPTRNALVVFILAITHAFAIPVITALAYNQTAVIFAPMEPTGTLLILASTAPTLITRPRSRQPSALMIAPARAASKRPKKIAARSSSARKFHFQLTV